MKWLGRSAVAHRRCVYERERQVRVRDYHAGRAEGSRTLIIQLPFLGNQRTKRGFIASELCREE